MRRRQWCHFTGLPSMAAPPTPHPSPRLPGSRSHVQAPCLPKRLQPHHPPNPTGLLTGAHQPCARVVSHTGLPTRPRAGRWPAWEAPGRGHSQCSQTSRRGTQVGNAEPRAGGAGQVRTPLRAAFGLMEGWASATSHAHTHRPGLADRQSGRALRLPLVGQWRAGVG